MTLRTHAWFALALLGFGVCSCSREQPPASATIAPVAGRPSPPDPRTQTIGSVPIVTTSGSPSPWPDEHATLEEVMVEDTAIRMRTLLPRGQTAFRITNKAKEPRTLEIDDAPEGARIGHPLAPGETVIVQMILSRERYVFRSPEARTSTVVRTYIPQ